MGSFRIWWLLFLFMTGCVSLEQAPVEDRTPRPKPVAKKPAPKPAETAKAAQAKDWRPESHVVKQGDTLYSIGLEYGYDYRDIAKANNIPEPYSLYVGQRLSFKNLKSDGSGTPIGAETAEAAEGVVIKPLETPGTLSAQPTIEAAPLPPPVPMITEPKAIREPYSLQALNNPLPAATPQPAAAAAAPTPAETASPAEAATTTEPAPAEASATAAAADSAWAWPTQGKIIKGFSESSGNRGIDIAGTLGQPVTAAGPGKVIYSGSDLRGYGKLVIIKHDSTFLSVYAHNSNILVKEGQQVAKGQKIAEMGNTDTDQVKLHFEIRQQGKSVDPMKFLSGNPG